MSITLTQNLPAVALNVGVTPQTMTLELGNFIKGDVGPQGPQGVKGEPGPQGPKGDTGLQGDPGTTSWSGLTDVPSQFPPSAHTHGISDVTGLQSALDSNAAASAGRVSAAVAAFYESIALREFGLNLF